MLWLRLVHILAGVFWVGSAVFLAAIVLPAARAAGAEGGHFMERLMQQPRTRAALGGLATILAAVIGAARRGRSAALVAALLVLAVAAMVTARYL